MAPSLIDLSGGAAILQEGAAADSPFDEYLPAFAGRALERRGFRGAARSILYELDPRALDWPRYERVAAYAARRFGLRVVSARKMGERAACEAIARLSRTDAAFAHTDEETAAMLAGLGSRWSRSLTQIALLDGEPVGYLLALEDRRMGAIRAATLQARPDFRGRALPPRWRCRSCGRLGKGAWPAASSRRITWPRGLSSREPGRGPRRSFSDT